MSDIETLRGLHALATTLVARINDALVEHAQQTALREPSALARGKTPAAIVTLLRAAGPMKPGEVAHRLREAGRDVSKEAVQQACHRLAKARTLRKSGTVYAANETERT